MRLPQSVNTKPDRGGVIATILELHPDRRYPFSAFEWLKADEKRTQPSGITRANLEPNGNHRLSRRTEDYLTNGAPEKHRNLELFAAACDMRDAGYTQSETERMLVPRHVADGCTEIEAVKSIGSAVRRVNRCPIKARTDTNR